jgi:short-subunit dehydrogenase
MEKIRRQFDVNVIGLLETTKAVLPHFRANKEGIIINISSIGGKITFPLGTLYHGTKFAVEGRSEALSFEMEAIGVKVKIVEPGAIRTDFAGRSSDFNNDESMAEYQDIVGSCWPHWALSSRVARNRRWWLRSFIRPRQTERTNCVTRQEQTRSRSWPTGRLPTTRPSCNA